jgi:hypothetical protein
LLKAQSLLVLGEPGAGKTTVGNRVKELLEDSGYTVAIASYAGAAKETLTAIADQLGVDTMTDDERPKQLTAAQLRDTLLQELRSPKTLLIADDAHRWSASLRYWLEDLHRAGALLLLMAWEPQPKDIFQKLPIFELRPLPDEQVRDLMYTEAEAHGRSLSIRELAELQQRAGNNPAIARRIVRETILGLGEERSQQHYQYIDGTPFLVALLMTVGVVRLVGLGMGDKALYVMGGSLTLAALIIRSVLYAANRGRRKL